MDYSHIVEQIARCHDCARAQAASAVNFALTLRNWLVGAYIVEFEQQGEDRAKYGARLLPSLAKDLRRKGYTGLSLSNLKNYRQFALAYPQMEKSQTVSGFLAATEIASSNLLSPLLGDLQQAGTALSRTYLFPSLAARADEALPWQNGAYADSLLRGLSWSHFVELIRLDSSLKRAFYEIESMKSRWDVRALRRQMDTMLYERIGLSKNKDSVLSLANQGLLTQTPEAIVRDPYILEFLGLSPQSGYSESDLEQALLNHLQRFIHELGRDFCFVERQHRITVGGRHHYLDLLFYHRALRCLIALELKLGSFKHEHAGQMNFYLNYLREEIARPDENPPVGIILCAERDVQEVHFATAGMDRQLFVSRYLVELPSEQQLKDWLRQEQEQLGSLRDAKSVRAGDAVSP
ncbi:MAG TPA: PDDEXK nuclease domain-containing protein [Pseudomonadota bacterium]|nr:PDDEXK nuclease domain-containing protein [Pseudomonadota bacterium]